MHAVARVLGISKTAVCKLRAKSRNATMAKQVLDTGGFKAEDGATVSSLAGKATAHSTVTGVSGHAAIAKTSSAIPRSGTSGGL